MVTLILISAALLAEDGHIVVEAESTPESDAEGSKTEIKINANRPGMTDLADAMRMAPGNHIRRYGGLGDYATVSIRGASSRQVQVFLDGIPLNPDGASAVNLAELPLPFFEKVSIWRSAAPASYFAAPIGGVVDLQPTLNLKGTAHFEAGSYGWERIGGGVGFKTKKTNHLLIMNHFNSTGDFDYLNTQATRFNVEDDVVEKRRNNEKSQINVLHRSGDENWSLISHYVQRSEGLPGTLISQTEHTSLDSNRLMMGLKWQKLTAKAKAHLLGWGRRGTERYVDQYGEFGHGITDETNRFDSLGLQTQFRYLEWSRLQPGIGYAVRKEAHQVDSAHSPEDNASRGRWIHKAYVDTPLWGWDGKLKANGVIQANLNPDQNAINIASNLIWAPRASLHWQEKAWRMWAAGGRRFRPPTMYELYGQQGIIQGNPDLKPEIADTVDIGLAFKAHKSNLFGQFAGFSQTAQNHIILVQNAQRMVFPTNFGKTWIGGLEAQMGWSWKNRLAIDGALTWMQSRNQSLLNAVNGNELPLVPNWTWNQSHTYKTKQFTLQHQLYFTSGWYRDATNWEQAAPNAIHNISLQFKPLKQGPKIEIQCRNVGNQRFAEVDIDPLQSSLGKTPEPISDFVGYPLPGRVFLMKMSWNLNPETK